MIRSLLLRHRTKTSSKADPECQKFSKTRTYFLSLSGGDWNIQYLFSVTAAAWLGAYTSTHANTQN
jgi:hypothetical protein